MTTEERRKEIFSLLEQAYPNTLTATNLADKFGVSRQVIVGDISVLRAGGKDIISTARGYVIVKEPKTPEYGYVGVLHCSHNSNQLAEELYTIINFGADILDVIIVHNLYGELSCKLDLSSKYEVDKFIENSNWDTDKPLCFLTGGNHLHTIGCKDKETFELIKKALAEKNMIVN